MMNKDNTQKTAPSAVFVNIEEIAAIIREQVALGQSVELPPRGISMRPLIREGRDSVILSPVSGRLKKYDIPFYRRHDGTYVLHRVVGFDKGGYIMCGDNQFVREHGIGDGDRIHVICFYDRAGGSKCFHICAKQRRRAPRSGRGEPRGQLLNDGVF